MKANTTKYLLVLFPVLISGCSAFEFFRQENLSPAAIGSPVPGKTNRIPDPPETGSWIKLEIPDTALVLLEYPSRRVLFTLSPEDSFKISTQVSQILVATPTSETIRIPLSIPGKRLPRYQFKPKFKPKGDHRNLWDFAIAGGNLTILTDPDAKLYLGGQFLGTGSTTVLVRPGSYSVRITRHGGFQKDDRISLAEDENKIHRVTTRLNTSSSAIYALVPGSEHYRTGNRIGFLTEFGLFSSSALLLGVSVSDPGISGTSAGKIQAAAGAAGLLVAYGAAFYPLIAEPGNEFFAVPESLDEKIRPTAGRIRIWEYQFKEED